MKEDLISIVIPVYNVEKYIKKCLESVLNQTYKNLEIIIVDDGSPDLCPKICDEYAKKDNRIRVIHKENGGLSDARNVGILHSTGKYITFIDSDDWVKNDFVESLYNNLVNNNCDISCCGIVCYFEKNGMYKIKGKEHIKKIYSKIEAQKYLNILGYFDVAAWNKLYKKELFNGIKFPIGKTSEDYRIMFKIFDKINQLYYDSEPKYVYRQRTDGSITKTNSIRMDGIEAAISAYNFYNVQKKYSDVIPYVCQSIIIQCIGEVNKMEKTNDYKRYNEIYSIVNEYKNSMTYRKIKIYKKIQIFVFLHYKKLYIKISKLLKK